MNFKSFVIAIVVTFTIVVVIIPIVDAEWSEEEFQRFENDLSQLADSYFPFEAQSSAKSQHSTDNTGMYIVDTAIF